MNQLDRIEKKLDLIIISLHNQTYALRCHSPYNLYELAGLRRADLPKEPTGEEPYDRPIEKYKREGETE